MSSSPKEYPVPDVIKKLLDTLGDQLVHIKPPSRTELESSFERNASKQQPPKSKKATPANPKD